MKRILIVDDDQVNAQIMQYYLDQSGDIETVWAKDAHEAIDACKTPFDLILLDIMLPDINGVELCKHLRERVYCPILFISCISDEDTVIKALETGGDDYLVKPFSCSVLMARISANLRRVEMENQKAARAIVRSEHFVLDTNEHTLRVKDRVFHLSTMEFEVLLYMIRAPYRTLSPEEIYEAVWGTPSYGDVRTVISHVYNLRRKLEDNPQKPRFIRSVRGYGYFFCPDGRDA